MTTCNIAHRALWGKGRRDCVYPEPKAPPGVGEVVSTRRVGHVKQQGQALVLGLLLVGLMALAWLYYAGASRLVDAKARQIHGLDAASYSGALVQARALNLLSLLNRAQLGHQVAMAHLTALGAWAEFGGTQAQQLTRGNPPAYLIAMLFGSAHGKAYLAAAAATGMQAQVSALMQAHARHDQVVHDVLQTVQQRIVQSLPQARRQAILMVLAQHYDRDARELDAHLDIFHDDWPGYVRQIAAADTFVPFLRRVQQRYAFLGPRNHTARNAWAVHYRCPSLRHELRRRGATQLNDQGQWQSFDTQSYHALRSNRWIGCYYREYPMAWAWVRDDAQAVLNAPHVTQPPADFSSQDFWRWVQSSTDWNIATGTGNPLANSRAVAGAASWGGRGLGAYVDVDAARRRQASAFQTRLRLPDASGHVITTHSAAASYYALPPGVQSAQGAVHAVPAHLFLPYWQAHLIPVEGL